MSDIVINHGINPVEGMHLIYLHIDYMMERSRGKLSIGIYIAIQY